MPAKQTVYSMQEVGDFVRLRRRELGITQTQLAALCGTGVRFISELERGKQTLEMGRVLMVLGKMDISVIIAF